MLSKDKLIFDETDVASSDQVGAHLLGSGNAKITSSTDGLREALDVNDSLVRAELVAVNNELDTHTTSLAAIQGKTDQLTFNAGRLEVLADIRLESDVADDAIDTENPFKMGSRAIDGALFAISASGDKANVVSDMFRRVYVNNAPNVGFKVSTATVGLTAAELVSVPLLGRVRLMIQNLGNKEIYIGFDNTVTATTGLRITAGAFLEIPFGEDLDIWAISLAAGQDIRIVEIA